MFLDRVASLALLIAFVAILWVVQIVNIFLDYSLNQYGLVPRTIEGLRGIPLSPFLHGGFGHLVSNDISPAHPRAAWWRPGARPTSWA